MHKRIRLSLFTNDAGGHISIFASSQRQDLLSISFTIFPLIYLTQVFDRILRRTFASALNPSFFQLMLP